MFHASQASRTGVYVYRYLWSSTALLYFFHVMREATLNVDFSRSRARLPASPTSTYRVTFLSVLSAMRVCNLQCIDVLLVAQLIYSQFILLLMSINETSSHFRVQLFRRGPLSTFRQSFSLFAPSDPPLTPPFLTWIASVFFYVGVRECPLSSVTQGSVKLWRHAIRLGAHTFKGER